MQTAEIVLFDSEFTAWEGSLSRNWSLDWEHREIFQLAAVKIRVDAYGVEVLGSFNQLIKPLVNPNLSEYIANLTGISQQMVDEQGVDFQSSLNIFHQFCLDGVLKVFSWGHDARVLNENCALLDIDMPYFTAGLHDLRQFAKHHRLSGCDESSGELAASLGIGLQGHAHNALFDVRSIAAALDHWIKTKELVASSLITTQ